MPVDENDAKLMHEYTNTLLKIAIEGTVLEEIITAIEAAPVPVGISERGRQTTRWAAVAACIMSNIPAKRAAESFVTALAVGKMFPEKSSEIFEKHKQEGYREQTVSPESRAMIGALVALLGGRGYRC